MKLFYLYDVKIALPTPSLPSIFTDQFSPADIYDGLNPPDMDLDEMAFWLNKFGFGCLVVGCLTKI